MSYSRRLHEAIRAKGTPALVGIDPRFDSLPPSIIEASKQRSATDRNALVAGAFEEFSIRLIDVVAPLVPAVKPQAAFFEEFGPEGCAALARVMLHARKAGLIVICDAKRGDIGSTAEAYARGYLAGVDPHAAAWAADALTVNPYLGADTLEPFVKIAEERAAGLYVLVRTSNPGAGTFQDLPVGRIADPSPSSSPTSIAFEEAGAHVVYQHVAKTVEALAANTARDEAFGSVGAVVGATYPRELAELRAAMPHAPLLIPGYGSQGGDASDVAAGFTAEGLGALVNSSRGIDFSYLKEPYASQFGPDRWEEAVEAATRAMIADLAERTPAGSLRA